MSDLLVTLVVAVAVALAVGLGLDALTGWWEARADRRADRACTRYNRCPECEGQP